MSDDPQTDQNPAPKAGRDRGLAIAGGAIALFVAGGVALIATSPKRPAGTPPELSLTGAEVAGDGAAPPVAIAMTTPIVDAGAREAREDKPRPPPVWRVASLKSDAAVEVVEATVGKRTFAAALGQTGLTKAEAHRVQSAFEGIARVSHPGPKDAVVVAKDRSKGTALAVEYVAGPMDIWQVRFDNTNGAAATASAGQPSGVAHKLELFVEQKRASATLVLGNDLAKAVAAAGLREDVVQSLDDALDGHVDRALIKPGARLRVVSTEDWVEGVFVRVRVDAIEFVPRTGPAHRLYYYEREPSAEGSHKKAPMPGFYDAKAQQPYEGAFRSPLLLARVTSRFNPKRLHPVLKVVMPHNGVDYRASTGTPVFASAAGTVTTAGNGGPCGTMVEIDHPGNLTTAYCHLSRLAAGLRSGQHVEARQLIGYVGQTGRVTGPHLHFAVKRGGVFIDPLGLKMDGVRVLPPSDREIFQKRRLELDGALETIALPSASDVVDAPDEPADQDLHGE